MYVNISKHLLRVKICHFSSENKTRVSKSGYFTVNRCYVETVTRWCHGNVFACVRCRMGGAASSIFRFHLIRPSFHVFPVAFAAIKERKCSRYCSLHRGIRQKHKFISSPPSSSFCLCLILSLDKCFPPFLMEKTEQKNKEEQRIFT